MGNISKNKKDNITILLNKTYKYEDVYLNKLYKANYIYEVRFVVLNDLRGTESIINTATFKDFVTREYNKEENKIYDTNINIRDLHSIDIHTNDKRKEEIERFNILNRKKKEQEILGQSFE